MYSIICIILMSGVFADSQLNDHLVYEHIEPLVSSTPTYQPIAELTSVTPYASAYTPESPQTVATSLPQAISEVPNVVSYGSSTTAPSNYASSSSPSSSPSPRYPTASSTVLTPYELYQNRWCEGLLRSPHAMPSDPSQLNAFQEQYVIPEYRSLWYRTCYLPTRGLGAATLWFDRGLHIANTAFRGAIHTANSALGVGQNVLRDLLNSNK